MQVGGAILVLIGAGLMVGLTSLFYAPIPNVAAILLAIGMPGVLLGALIGILTLGAGCLMLSAGRRLSRRGRSKA